jgi:hypothetical protein
MILGFEMAKVIFSDNFFDDVLILSKSVRESINTNVQIIIDSLVLIGASDDHTFLIYGLDILHIFEDYPVLSIKHDAHGVDEELIFTREAFEIQVRELSTAANENPDVEYLQKYRRMQIEIDMGM